MLRITDIKLPIDHDEPALKAAILKQLGVSAEALTGFSIFKRSVDARKKNAILYIYTVDIELRNEPTLLKRLKHQRQISPSPDIDYHFVARAPGDLKERPVIIGTGPCGIFTGLLLANQYANAPGTPGGSGVAANSIRNPTCSLAKGGRGRFRTVNFIVRSRIRVISAAR